MKFGLTDHELNILHKIVIDPLIQIKARVWIFGSRARGDHRPFSDIDILFELPPGKTLELSFLSEMKEEVEDSSLPYKVDIVNAKEVAESYRKGVLKDKFEF